MTIWSRLFGGGRAEAVGPRNAYQPSGGGTMITSSEQLAEFMRGGSVSESGSLVTTETAMTSSAVFACVRIRSGVPANMPLQIKRRIDARTREDASDHALWSIFSRKPNRWQTPSQFKRMLTAHVMLRGAGRALIVKSRGEIKELIPLHPDRIKKRQNDDLSIVYEYRRRNGGLMVLPQHEVFDLMGLTLDGVNGVSVLTYARETIGTALSERSYGAGIFKNGARTSSVLKHPGKLGPEGLEFLRASLDEYRSGGESEGKALVLEEGMDVSSLSMTSEDAQWIDSRKFSRTDIAMFFGVPPHMIGDTEKNTSWGTGIEAQTQGFVTFTAEDDLITWEETVNRDLISDDEPDIYCRFNRSALVRGDIKARWESYMRGRQMKVLSANDVRGFEDMNPVEGGDVYENPMINVEPDKENRDDPPEAA